MDAGHRTPELCRRGAPTTASAPCCKGKFTVDYFASTDLSGPVVHTDTQSEAQAFWIGRIADGTVDPLNFSARLTGSFTPERSGLHEVGIYSAGFGRVFVDGVLVADAWSNWQKGHTFFEEGCDEVVGTIQLEAGRAYEVVIEFATKAFATLGLAAFAAGIALPLGDDAIAEAVRTGARRRDGIAVRRPQWRVGHRGQRSRRHRSCPAGRTS